MYAPAISFPRGVLTKSDLQALNNSETLRLLTIIELSCYTCKQVVNDPQIQGSYRRRIARAIKDDRRKRHKRRKDADTMFAAFAKTGLSDEPGAPQAASTSSATPEVHQ